MAGDGTETSIQPMPGGRGNRAEIQLINRAIKGKWNIPPAVYERLPKRLAYLATRHGASPREAVQAARVLVAMNEQNGDPVPGQGVNVNVNINAVAELRQQMLKDDGYLEYLRDRDSRELRALGQRREVEASQTPPAD